MPLIKPEVQKVLRAAGLEKPERVESLYVHQHLDQTGLSNEKIAEELTDLAINNQNPYLKLRALRDATPAAPNFTIVIQNSSPDLNFNSTGGVNPIIFPRQSLALSKTLNQALEEVEDEELKEDDDNEDENGDNEEGDDNAN